MFCLRGLDYHNAFNDNFSDTLMMVMTRARKCISKCWSNEQNDCGMNSRRR